MGITPEEVRVIVVARDQASAKIQEVALKIQALDLDSEATITITDVLEAREAWRRDAPAQYRELLDATVEPPKGG